MDFVPPLPEQEEKAVDLQNNSDDGPANQHHQHTSQEETGGLHFVLLEEEAEGPLQPDDKGKSSNKKDLQRKKGYSNIREWPNYWSFRNTDTFFYILTEVPFSATPSIQHPIRLQESSGANINIRTRDSISFNVIDV